MALLRLAAGIAFQLPRTDDWIRSPVEAHTGLELETLTPVGTDPTAGADSL